MTFLRDIQKISKKKLLSITFYNLIKELYGVKIAKYVKGCLSILRRTIHYECL